MLQRLLYTRFKGPQLKIHNQELLFLRSARLIELKIRMKGHEDILTVSSQRAHTQICDRQMDGRTDDHGKNNMSPNPEGAVDVKS